MTIEINQKVAAMFDDVGNSLQYQGEAWVKVRSYLKIAEVLRGLDEPIDAIVAAGRVDQVEGVGRAISKKIREYLADGTFNLLRRLDEEVPSGVRAMIRAGIAPSLVHHLESTGLDTLEKVEASIDSGELTEASVPAKVRAKLREYLASRAPR